MQIDELLHKRDLPDLMAGISDSASFDTQKPNILRLFSQYAYGGMPGTPDTLSVVVTGSDSDFCAGKATLRNLRFDVTYRGDSFSFPVYAAVPEHASDEKIPAIVFLNFRSEPFDAYLPMEEIMDRGYAVFGIHYEAVSSDDEDFLNGCAKYLCPDRTLSDAPGKLVIWAWAAIRVMDYVSSLKWVDLSSVAVAGHSRLGKSALIAAACDTRFRYVIANNSGCMGGALTRGKTGEDLKHIAKTFPYWFCPEFSKMVRNGETFPFDQHNLLSLIAPRRILLGCAQQDAWADPISEYLCLCKANEAYHLYGMKGFLHPDELPCAPCDESSGDNAYHLRRGVHYLSRTDWQKYLSFIDHQRDSAR